MTRPTLLPVVRLPKPDVCETFLAPACVGRPISFLAERRKFRTCAVYPQRLAAACLTMSVALTLKDYLDRPLDDYCSEILSEWRNNCINQANIDIPITSMAVVCMCARACVPWLMPNALAGTVMVARRINVGMYFVFNPSTALLRACEVAG